MRRFLHILTLWLVCATALLAYCSNSDGEKLLIRLYFDDYKQEAPLVAAEGFDIAGVNLRQQTMDIVIYSDELFRLQLMGIKYELIYTEKEITVDPDFKTPAEVAQILSDYEADYPDIAKVYSIGTTLEGRNIWAMKISDNVDQDEDEFAINFNGCHHAREDMSIEVPLDIIEYLLTGYGSDPQATKWVNKYEFWIIPMVNPDGNNYMWTSDSMWRKNRRPGSTCYGVDNNRNYPYNWGGCGGSSGNECADDYRGPSAGSELETQAMVALANNQRFVTSISYHSYSELVLYPYSCSGEYTADHDAISQIGITMANLIQGDSGGHYTPGTPWEILYAVDGGDIDWYYNELGDFPFVVELNSSSQGFHPDYSWRDPTCQRNRPGWQYLINRLEGPGIYGHVRNACTGEPLEATISISEIDFSYNEKPRRSHPQHGSYLWMLLPGTYHVNFTKVGFSPLTLEVSVGNDALEVDGMLTPLGANGLMVYSSTVLDGEEGDGDQTVDPGESFKLRISAVATGGDLTGISAIIDSVDPYLTINDDTASFPDIPGGQSAASIEPHFAMSVSEQCPEGHYVDLNITFYADQDLCINKDKLSLKVSEYAYSCPIYEETLDIDPGWSISNSGSGGWEFGIPQGKVSGPTGGNTGFYVYGTNLNGNYGDNVNHKLTAGPFDCSLIQDTELIFYRWLGNENGYDTAYVEVSPDGFNWTVVWGGYAQDTSWKRMQYDISPVADGVSTVFVRFRLTSDTSVTDCGFYVDDLSICGNTVSIPNFRLDSITYDDRAGACFDGDGYLDLGEEADLNVTIKNIGNTKATGTIVRIYPSSEHIFIPSNEYPLGEIASYGGSGTAKYRLIALDDTECMETVDLNIVITSSETSSSAVYSMMVDLDIEEDTGDHSNGFEVEPQDWLTSGWEHSSEENHTPMGTKSMHTIYVRNACSRLTSPAFRLSPTGSSKLRFWSKYDIENKYDGGIVQVLVEGSNSWQTLSLTPSYPGSTNSTTSSCIGQNQPCFTGTDNTWTEYVADLGSYQGETVRIGFLFGSDSAVEETGWYIDDVTISDVITETTICDQYPCGGATLTPTATPTETGIITPTPTATPTNTVTMSITPTATATYSSTVTVTATPSVTASATPTPSATATQPEIDAYISVGGYMATRLESRAGGQLVLMTMISGADASSVELVELYYQGMPTGVLLGHDCAPYVFEDENIYCLSLYIEPGTAPALKALLEVIPHLSQGMDGTGWPNLVSSK